jgi:molybdopterin-guanine dinucleotide biosynthesis protein A
LNRSAIILAGDSSAKFESDKGTLNLNGKPLISYVVNVSNSFADEVIIVTDSQKRTDLYAEVLSPGIKFVVNNYELKGDLASALAGFEAAKGEYSALLPSDSPFVSPEVMNLLFDCCIGKTADIPRSTDMECNPLHAVYHTQQAKQAAKEALAENETDVQAMVERMRGVRYMSLMVIKQLDPDLKTFFRVKTSFDLKKATVMDKPRKTAKTKKQY